MPCDGIVVQGAQVAINLEERLRGSQETREGLRTYLVECGIQGVGEWRPGGDPMLSVAGGDLYFRAERIKVYKQTRSGQAQNAANALEAAQQYASELMQADVLQAFRAAGYHTWGVQQKSDNAVLVLETVPKRGPSNVWY
ncbi:MAG TPA: hypothetical protein VKQ72_06780 [Aggregatilineales bacterium]|nr:hypothetical protein [Aggregatilineales bacterium]